jgi:hypothetical protein
MPIESLQPRAPISAYAAGEGGTPSLPAGTIEARVTAILENGLARFATAFGFVDLATPEPMSIGARAQLLVENTGIRILLTQLGASSSGSAGTTGAIPSPSASSAQPARPTTVAQPTDPVTAQLATAARAATATQQSPAALLSRLVPLLAQSAGALPADVQRAAAQVLALPLRADQTLDPAVLQAAMRQSGLFREARGTATAPDWKQALVGLRSALAAWAPQPAEAAAGTAASDVQDTPASPAPAVPGQASRTEPGNPAEAARLLATVTARAGTATAESPAPASAITAEEGEAAPAQRASTAAPSASAAMLTPDDPVMALRGASPALLGQLVARAFGAMATNAGRPTGSSSAEDSPSGSVVALPPRDRVAPPRADQPPRALPPEVAPEQWLGADPATQRDTLLALTEGALDRVRLSQFASLPREQAQAAQPQPHATPQQPAWVFDVPVFVGREAAVAQFRVSQDGKGSGQAGSAGERWSMDVAIDTSETGPVHARVRLGGGAIGITLWAERPDMVERLKTDMPDLRRTLDAAAFTVEDLSILPGSPQAQPVRASGYFLDTRS